jgi:hypothetical protein
MSHLQAYLLGNAIGLIMGLSLGILLYPIIVR